MIPLLLATMKKKFSIVKNRYHEHQNNGYIKKKLP